MFLKTYSVRPKQKSLVRILLVTKITSILILVTTCVTFAQSPVFRAGASTANITPYLGQGIAGGWLPLPLATNIHDEEHVRSLVLDDGKIQLVLVVVDNVEIPREVFDEAKRMIFEATRIPKEHMTMSSTHNHSSVWAGPEINPPEPSRTIREHSDTGKSSWMTTNSLSHIALLMESGWL